MACIKESLKSTFVGVTTSGTKVTLGRMKSINGLFYFVLLLEVALFSNTQHYVKTFKGESIKETDLEKTFP